MLAGLTLTGSGWSQTRSSSQPKVEQDEEEIVELSRFVVSASDENGYRASSTLAGARIKTDLKDVGSALTVVTSQFLKDTASRSTEELLVYTTGTEVGGPGGNFTGTGNAEILTERNALATPHTNNRVRGLAVADSTRDLFLTDIPWDSYNVERVELQRGANSILFGLGKPGGVINASIKQASFAPRTRIEARIDGEGGYRGALDHNQVLLTDQMALRLNLLKNRDEYQQEPAFKDDERLFAALRFDPAFLRTETARTSLRLNIEHGRIDANNPRNLPPMDRLTPWFETGTTVVDGKVFNNLNQFTGDFRYRNAYFATVPNSGFLVASSAGYQPGITDANNGNYAFIPDPTTGVAVAPYYTPQTAFTETSGLAPNGTVDGTIRGLFGANRLVMVATNTELMRRLGIPFAFAYKNKAITDPTIFDFYHKLIDGPNKSEDQNFDTFNATLSQTFLRGRAGIELAYDRQDYELANESPFYGLGTGDAAITVDVNTHLPDGTPNPNVGRPLLVQRTINGGYGRISNREVMNATAYLELHARDHLRPVWLQRLIGRHLFTGSATRNDAESRSDTWASAALVDTGWDTEANKLITNRRELAMFTYLGPDMRGRSSPAGLNLSNVNGNVRLPDQDIVLFNSTWNRPTNPSSPGYVNPGATWTNPFNNQKLTQSENPENYIGWQRVPVQTITFEDGNNPLLTFASTKSLNRVDSRVFVWQGHLFDGLVVPTYGYRKDTAKSYTVRAPVSVEGIVDLTPSLNKLPAVPDDVVSGSSKTYSVVLHSPRWLRDRLPGGIDLSLTYNRSTNFEPVAGRIDVLGRALPNPTGTTEDYGIVLSALEDRVQLRVNKFEAASQNTSYAPQNLFHLMQTESTAWIRAKQYQAGLSGNPTYAGADYNYGTLVNGVFIQTQADRDRQARDVKAVLDTFAPEIWAVFGNEPTDTRWQNNQVESVYSRLPTGYTGTEDTVSRGYEFELYLRPTRGWDVMINAARVDASRSNIGGQALNEWVDRRNAVWNGPAGQILNSGTGAVTLSDMWNLNFYNNYQMQRMQNGASVPEIRRWRFNAISTYRFGEGRLRGVRLGGALRWEDRVGIGYHSAVVDINGTPVETVDVNKPFWGPDTTTVDAWVGYSRKLGGRYNWSVQLNVRNLFGTDELIPINIQPDGGPAAFRIRYGATWALSQSLEF